MPAETARRPVLRSRTNGEAPEVGAIELFFDLVYVFTVIQLSHFLLAHLTGTGALRALVLFAAVWWGWNYTAWAMNWLDPDSVPVRLLTAFLMLMALGMAIALPEAFGKDAVLFAAAYVCLQVVRSAFMVWACRGRQLGGNYARLLAWSALSGAAWLTGALGPEDQRLGWWLAAVVIDYAAPLVDFRLPGLGSAPARTWPLHREHLAERNRLVFIIALGESILIMGFTLDEVELTGQVVATTVIGFAGLVLLWWNYFGFRPAREREEDPAGAQQTAIARSGFAYAHAVMIAGAIVVAVSIEQVTLHPTGPVEPEVAVCVAGGPVLYLLGNLLYLHARTGVVALSRLVVAALLALLGVVAGTTGVLNPLALAAATVACMFGLALYSGLTPLRCAPLTA
ncbi:low temperature requirement protein A [Streptomyces boncukensis]|uniref:Low temperature requirement protein A n=1 Tax=Streptomyces boncukensis TaxID=2711219 RepID=A0A6G4WZ13_9ACTN|nr:low temperature requirement protein A [Streptomyces boncukensis]NGO70358.1 low temperature requirement protein A [Streptomyces boncukensis]